MKYWFGYLVAAIFGAISWVLLEFGQRFTVLIDMVYPYVIRTLQDVLAQWSGQVDFLLWQLLAIVIVIVVLGFLVLFLVMKWNPIQWGGWALAVCTFLYMLHTLLWGLNYYAGPLTEDLRLEVSQYTLDELVEATEYYRDKANTLADRVERDGNGDVAFPEFSEMANRAGRGFQMLVYEYSFPVFAGSQVPVKELGWADMYTSMGITGVTMGLTGEAAVNPQIPDVTIPFTMCHEMAHRMCIASERDANFSAFLACSVHPDLSFEYSGYFMAYRYCHNALASLRTQSAIEAATHLSAGVNANLARDIQYYDTFFRSNRSESATNLANTANDTYLKVSGETSGIASYGEVCDLLVNWHIQQVVLPSITEEEQNFNPYDKTQVDISDIPR